MNDLLMSDRPLQNCQLSYLCDKTWDELFRTRDADVRFCLACKRPVFACHSEADLSFHLSQHHCIAFLVDEAGEEVCMMVGNEDSDYPHA